jgi:hypothetical protein
MLTLDRVFASDKQNYNCGSCVSASKSFALFASLALRRRETRCPLALSGDGERTDTHNRSLLLMK